jgi:hypothetical protein
MDEGDLVEFWGEGSGFGNALVFEVTAGGWHAWERERNSFSGYRTDLREFLVPTHWECLSVLSTEPPVIIEQTD